MNKTSNAKVFDAPTLWVVIDDLRIPCAVPTLDVTERIMDRAAHFMDLPHELSQERYDYAFDLFAEILSCNHNFVTYTPEDLKAKNVTVSHIIGILTDWVQFIGELANQKN